MRLTQVVSTPDQINSSKEEWCFEYKCGWGYIIVKYPPTSSDGVTQVTEQEQIPRRWGRYQREPVHACKPESADFTLPGHGCTLQFLKLCARNSRAECSAQTPVYNCVLSD